VCSGALNLNVFLAGRPTGSSSRCSRQCAPTWLSSERRAASAVEWSWAWAVVARVWAEQAAPKELEALQVPHGGSCQPEQVGQRSAGERLVQQRPAFVACLVACAQPCWADCLTGQYHLAVTPLLPYTHCSCSSNPLVANVALIQLSSSPHLVHDLLAQAVCAFALCAALTSRAQAWTRHFRRVLEWRPVHDLVACARAERKQSPQAGIHHHHTLVGPMWHQ
jgi:hypothetical protein